jgi:hypothetical protein
MWMGMKPKARAWEPAPEVCLNLLPRSAQAQKTINMMVMVSGVGQRVPYHGGYFSILS